MKIFSLFFYVATFCLSVSFFYSQTTEGKELIDLTKDIEKEKMFTHEMNIVNMLAIVIIIMLVIGIAVLIKVLKSRNQNWNSSFQILDKFFLDQRVTIYVLKIYGEIIKLAVSKGGVTYLGIVTPEKSNGLPPILNDGKESKKLDASVNYMKIMEGINNIEEKIDKWKSMK